MAESSTTTGSVSGGYSCVGELTFKVGVALGGNILEDGVDVFGNNTVEVAVGIVGTVPGDE